MFINVPLVHAAGLALPAGPNGPCRHQQVPSTWACKNNKYIRCIRDHAHLITGK